jgi:large subunit ribosomal protein L9
LARPIKTVGMHDVIVKLHPEVSVTVRANVARSPEEAEMQAQGKRISRAGDEDDDPIETPFPSSYDPDAADDSEQPYDQVAAEAADEPEAGEEKSAE